MIPMFTVPTTIPQQIDFTTPLGFSLAAALFAALIVSALAIIVSAVLAESGQSERERARHRRGTDHPTGQATPWAVAPPMS
jgi:hypothetical protein